MDASLSDLAGLPSHTVWGSKQHDVGLNLYYSMVQGDYGHYDLLIPTENGHLNILEIATEYDIHDNVEPFADYDLVSVAVTVDSNGSDRATCLQIKTVSS